MKVFLVTFLAANMFFSIAYGGSDLPAAPNREKSVVVGYSSKVFVDVDIRDAQIATKLWTDKFIQKMGSPFEISKTVVFDNLVILENDIKTKSIDIIILFSQEFIEMRSRSPLVPVYATDYGKYFYYDMLVLARENRGINRFSDLKDKRFSIEMGQKGSLPMIWLETLLAKDDFSDPKTYFSSLKEAGRTSQVVLPVFFGQTDGCIVGRNGFEMMVELNPQVGEELRVIGRSPGFLAGVVCLRKDFYQKYGKSATDAVESLLREHRDLMARVAQRK